MSSEFWFYGSSRRYDANCVNQGEWCIPSKNYDDNGKSPFFIGDTSSNGWFSSVILVFRGVILKGRFCFLKQHSALQVLLGRFDGLKQYFA